jgi:cytochrome c-type biogenesis protein
VDVYLGAFLGGVGATITPCILPLYPGFLAFVTAGAGAEPGAGARRIGPARAALLVWAGVVTGMIAIGAAIALVAAPLGDFNRIVLPVADLLLIAIGILLLLGRNPFARLPQPAPAALGGHGPDLGAYLYGLLFAPIAVPCSGPFLVGIFAYSLTIGDAVGRLLFFTVFGIGFGLPLFVIGLLGQARGTEIAKGLVRRERLIQLGVGIVLVAVGAWDLSANLPLILA